MENLEQKRRVLKRLREWREKEATRAGVELFRVLSNDAMNGIAENLPTTKDALLEVKGIAEKKYQTYGRDILSIVTEESVGAGRGFQPRPERLDNNTDSDEILGRGQRPASGDDDEMNEGEQDGYRQSGEKIFTVGDYLELLNVGLQQFDAKVVGEISSLDIRGNYLFFSIKDKKENAMMPCFMWGSAYKMSGVALEEGMEIQVHGFPEMYKPSGRLTFKADTVELVGEGALKKAYDDLKKKLEKEGLFAESRKKPIPEYPQNIGLITSATGAVIHDFLNNIGKFGFKISFRDSRVEGALAVKELVQAVRYFKKSFGSAQDKQKGIDVLVIIRGGGSLESLQAFNNETLVREIADCPFPVVVGIGHDKDVPIVSLVADRAGSTPTAVAKLLNFTWDSALSNVRLSEQKIFNRFSEQLYEKKDRLRGYSENIEESFRRIFERFRNVEEKLKRNLVTIGSSISQAKERMMRIWKLFSGKQEDLVKRYKEELVSIGKRLEEKLRNDIRHAKEKIMYAWKMIDANDPNRQLRLGYSIVKMKGEIIRRVEDVKSGDEINIHVENGIINTEVK